MNAVRRRFSTARNRLANRGFTLIEMLVVISITALMASALVPALQSARNASIASNCQSNKRQISYATSIYQSDFNGFNTPTWKLHNAVLTPGTPDYQRKTDFSLGPDDRLNGVPAVFKGTQYAGWTWAAYLMGNLGSVDPLICPSDQSSWVRQDMAEIREADPDEGMGYIPINGSYGLNHHIYGSLNAAYWVRPEKLEHPNDTAYTFDYTLYVGGVPLHAAGYYASWPGLFSRPTTATPNPVLAANERYLNMAMNPRHPGTTINALFHDGHVGAYNVFNLHDPDQGGIHGLDNTGITEQGAHFWGYGHESQSHVRIRQDG